ncbi:hypothetical protein KDJ56_03320 [Brevibacillus composti]|uniref:Uncharacterized protein n=1 Tax=Brevibacillus composti TaxID=2796470 RepID=A0A7T5ELU6_9BACL|nr:hypothetical protein [Brevibacillus composti]QQE74990.1 hypothetical protein JD108_03315 [Brevibacillus composti]QUO42075.1 hypothetical protein KDJ56_03320 [Brevibacillus composti]
MGFEIPLLDQIISFQDIIELTDEQRAIILEVSKNKTFEQWIDIESGVKIPLHPEQRETVLRLKNGLVAAKDKRELVKGDTIIFTRHARERIAVRVDKFSKEAPPTFESILLVVQLVIESDFVDDHAEWKGYPKLAYTLVHTGYGEKFKITVSFEMVDQEHIKVITVSNEHISELTASLMELPEISDKLREFKRSLLGLD